MPETVKNANAKMKVFSLTSPNWNLGICHLFSNYVLSHERFWYLNDILSQSDIIQTIKNEILSQSFFAFFYVYR